MAEVGRTVNTDKNSLSLTYEESPTVTSECETIAVQFGHA